MLQKINANIANSMSDFGRKKKKRKKKRKYLHIYLPNTYRLGLGALCNYCHYQWQLLAINCKCRSHEKSKYSNNFKRKGYPAR